MWEIPKSLHAITRLSIDLHLGHARGLTRHFLVMGSIMGVLDRRDADAYSTEAYGRHASVLCDFPVRAGRAIKADGLKLHSMLASGNLKTRVSLDRRQGTEPECSALGPPAAAQISRRASQDRTATSFPGWATGALNAHFSLLHRAPWSPPLSSLCPVCETSSCTRARRYSLPSHAVFFGTDTAQV